VPSAINVLLLEFSNVSVRIPLICSVAEEEGIPKPVVKFAIPVVAPLNKVFPT